MDLLTRRALTEIIKTLLRVAREHGHLTYDDINDILPDGVSADELDAIHTRLHELGIEITETPRSKKQSRMSRSRRKNVRWIRSTTPSGCT